MREPSNRLPFLSWNYKAVANNLESIHNFILQPQKQILVRNLLQNLMGRILEIRNELSEFKCCDFVWPGDVLSALDLSPVS